MTLEILMRKRNRLPVRSRLRATSLLVTSTIALAAVVTPSATAQVAANDKDLPHYTVAEAKKHIGETATVIGRIDCILEAAASQHLLFGDCYEGDATFCVYLRHDASGPELDVSKLKGITVAVSGKIEGTGVPVIMVRSTSQLVVPRESDAGELDAAISQEEKALQANPRDANAYYQRGVAREKKAALHQAHDGYRAAMDDYRQAIKLDPTKAEALVHTGDCCAALQDYGAARRAWDRAIEVSPQAKELLRDSIAKERTRHCYAAIHDVDKLTDMEPKNAALYYRKAKLYMMDHSNEQANKNFEKAAELEPTNLTYGQAASHPLAPSKELTAEQLMNNVIGGTVGAVATVFGAAAWADSKASSDSKRVVDASNGTKKQCPVCRGRGYSRFWKQVWNWPEPTNEWVEETCETCHGTGRVDE